MVKCKLAKAFKAYSQHQAMLFPPSLDELIGATQPVRVVSQGLDKIDIEPLTKKYEFGGIEHLTLF